MMNTAGAELRKANSKRSLHPFKSFSTSRLQWRVQPSPNRPDNEKKEPAGASGGGGFLAQLKRSFTLGHRSSSASASASASAAESKYKRSSSVHADGAGQAWGRRVKQGLSKPLKAVTESYVGCMMGIAEDHRVESLQGMGFANPISSEDVFKSSASRRYDRSSSCPNQISQEPLRRVAHVFGDASDSKQL